MKKVTAFHIDFIAGKMPSIRRSLSPSQFICTVSLPLINLIFIFVTTCVTCNKSLFIGAVCLPYRNTVVDWSQFFSLLTRRLLNDCCLPPI